jgi:cytoskeletal protein CcmA (bactofilin family)
MFFEKKSKSDTRRNDETAAVQQPVVESRSLDISVNRAKKGGQAVIGATVKIKGEVVSDEDIAVEGLIEGSIVLKNNELLVGSSGRVHADVIAKSIKVDGELHGDVEVSDRIVISSSGSMRGNIQAPRVILEDGAKFKGSIDMDEAAPAKAFGVVSNAAPEVKAESAAE